MYAALFWVFTLSWAASGSAMVFKTSTDSPQDAAEGTVTTRQEADSGIFTSVAEALGIKREATAYDQSIEKLQASIQQSNNLLREHNRLEQQTNHVCSKMRAELETCQQEVTKLVSFYNASITMCRKDKDKQVIQQLSQDVTENIKNLEVCQSNLTDVQTDLLLEENSIWTFKEKIINKTVGDFTSTLRWQQLYWVLLSFMDVGSPVCDQLEATGWDVSSGSTAPLQKVVSNNYTDLLTFLLDHGLDTETIVRRSEHHTLLLEASSDGPYEVAKILLDRGAKVNARSSNGNTPLIIASLKGRLELAQLLVEHGAVIGSVNYSGKTALSLASYSGRQDIVKFLENLMQS